jgi:hypothetical protein
MFVEGLNRESSFLSLRGWSCEYGKANAGAVTNLEYSQTNVQVFQIVLNIQNIITRIPGQVNRQQPVYFVDAMGRNMSFDLEFIMSADVCTQSLWKIYLTVCARP